MTRRFILSPIVPDSVLLNLQEPVCVPSVFAAMAEQGRENVQALAARFRVYAAETSLDTFRYKFEAAAEELEQLASLTRRSNVRGLGSPGTGSGRGYGR